MILMTRVQFKMKGLLKLSFACVSFCKLFMSMNIFLSW